MLLRSQQRLAALAERATRTANPSHAFLLSAIASIVLGLMSMVPYCNILQVDPSSPLALSFVMHIAVVGIYLPRVRELFRSRKIPIRYHAAMVVLACSFTTLKADAFVRLPTAVCLLLVNLRMLVGVAVQVTLFGKRYSVSQLVSVAVVTAGIALAGYTGAAQQKTVVHHTARQTSDFWIGVVEILVSCISLVLLVSIFKLAFARFGECTEEQFFVQHLCCLLLVFPSQWGKIGPHIAAWAHGADMYLVFNVVAGTSLNIAKRAVDSHMVGRAPTLIMAQLLTTLGSVLELLLAALMRVPPWPAVGFWAGMCLFALGTVQYFRASAEPHEAKDIDACSDFSRGTSEFTLSFARASTVP